MNNQVMRIVAPDKITKSHSVEVEIFWVIKDIKYSFGGMVMLFY